MKQKKKVEKLYKRIADFEKTKREAKTLTDGSITKPGSLKK